VQDPAADGKGAGVQGVVRPASFASAVCRSGARTLRQSITIPAHLAAEVRRVAKERHLTVSRAVVALAERGIQVEKEANDQLKIAYLAFMDEGEPVKKQKAGKDLIRTIFGADAITEDSVR
jgi:hypothetical protein